MSEMRPEDMGREAFIRVAGHGARINALEKEVGELRKKIEELSHRIIDHNNNNQKGLGIDNSPFLNQGGL